jgi:hypothetical protein
MITQYIDTKLNAADILTKSVDVAAHERHTDPWAIKAVRGWEQAGDRPVVKW